MDLPLAKKINYFKTSKIEPDTWIDKAKTLIEKFGGRIIQEGFANDALNECKAYLLVFEIGDDMFKVQWPVLPVGKKQDELAAKRQAATLIYHDVKAKCLTATVLGVRAAFFSYLLLSDGKAAAELAEPDLINQMPKMLKSG